MEVALIVSGECYLLQTAPIGDLLSLGSVLFLPQSASILPAALSSMYPDTVIGDDTEAPGPKVTELANGQKR